MNIVELIAGSSDFDLLEQALLAANLVTSVEEAEDITFFAPTDAAFIAVAQGMGYTGSDEAGAFGYLLDAARLLSAGADPIPLLTTILAYHISPGSKDAATVLSADTLPTLSGLTLGVEDGGIVDAEPDLPNATIIEGDIAADNGVLHRLDSVLIPTDVLPSDGSNAVDFLFFDDAANTVNLGDDNDYADMGGGNDVVEGGRGNDVIVGGDGDDTAVFANDFSNYAITIDGDLTILRDQGGLAGGQTGEDTLNGIELLEFGDGVSFAAAGAVSLTTLQGAARLVPQDVQNLVELYVAYFDRAPDALGVLFWANAHANGVTLRDIAGLFFDQPETQAELPASLDTGAFVDRAYNNALERDADAAGRAFWVNALDSGGVSRTEFMLELIAGARANTAAADDVRTIKDKADIGISYALINGLTNVQNAETVMAAYDRTDAAASRAEAQDLIAEFALLAQGAADGPETTIRIVGLVDDPFAVA